MGSSPQEHDVLVVKRSDGRYEITQIRRGAQIHLEGPFERDRAEDRGRELAQDLEVDAWIEEYTGTFRSLD